MHERNNHPQKRTPEELNLIDNYMYDSNCDISSALSILDMFIDSFDFDMANPSDANLYDLKNKWSDAGNVLFVIRKLLYNASNKLEEALL